MWDAEQTASRCARCTSRLDLYSGVGHVMYDMTLNGFTRRPLEQAVRMNGAR